VTMSGAVRHAAVRCNRSGYAHALRTLRRACRGLTWRHWLVAAGIGLLLGVLDSVWRWLFLDIPFPAGSTVLQFHAFLVMLTTWAPIKTGLACALLVVLAVLRDISKSAAIRPRDVAVTTLAVCALGSLVFAPLSAAAAMAVYSAFHLPAPGPFSWGVDWLTALSRLFAITGEKITTFATTVTLSAVYYFKDSRTSDALALVQLGLARAHKRRLTEELRSAQAMLDPEFLFATLAEVDRRFLDDPPLAQRLLDALIRYLRAAMPANDEAIGTVGHQATLIRAYLEIESIRTGGRMQGVIDIPADLEARPFAPALILPLVAFAARDAACADRETRVVVKASLAGGRVAVEVHGDGCEPRSIADRLATLDALRQRLAALYGSGAELTVESSPRRTRARIVVDDPGTP